MTCPTWMRLAVLTALGVGTLAAETLAGGPFVVNVTGRSATVGWVVEGGAVSLEAADGKSKSAVSLEARSVGFTGLEPGRIYTYSLPGMPDVKGTFKTAPAGKASFRFVVFGDTRTRHELHQKIADAVAKEEPDFVAHTGDLVSDGQDTGMWPVFFRIERELLRKTAFFPVLGNHERNSRLFHEFFRVATPYSSFNWGAVHVVLLNTDFGNISASGQERDRFWAEQIRWMEDDLAAAQKAQFRLVVMHHPPLTAVASRQSGTSRIAALMPIFEKHKVQAVFAGHDHNYQHHRKNGVTYIVTGGGGAPLYPVDGPIEGVTLKVERTEHYVRVAVTDGRMVLEAVALDGHLIDRVELPADDR